MICIDKEYPASITDSGSARVFIEQSVTRLSLELASKEVLLAYSGGIASAVCAVLLLKAEGVRLSSVLVDFRLPPDNNASKISTLYYEVFGGENLEVLDIPHSLLNELERVKNPSEKDRILGMGLTDLIARLARERGISIVGMGTTCEDIVAEKQARPSHHSIVYQPFGPDISLIEPVGSLSRVEVRMVGIELGLPCELTGSDRATMSYL